MNNKQPPCSLEDIIRMDRGSIMNCDVYLEVINNVDYYHVVIPGETKGKELDLGNTQRFLGVGLIDDIIRRYLQTNPTAGVDELKTAVVYYWNNSTYLTK